MQTVKLGRTGLEVSVAAFGAGGKSRLGQKQGASRADSVALVRRALDAGVNFLDTAAVYGTEEIIGEAVQGRRDDVVISTKAVITTDPQSDTLIDAPELARRVDASLARLGVDHIDIMHLHGVIEAHYDHARDVLLPELHRLRQAGKIRFTGITERFASATGHTMLEQATQDGAFDVIMVGFNIVNQTALRRVLPQARQQDIGTLCMFAVRGPLARLETANAIVRRLVTAGEVDPAAIDMDNPLGFLAAPEVAGSISQAAYRFCRHTPGIDVVITGTGSAQHLIDNLQAIQMPPLPPAISDRLTRIFANAQSENAEN